MTLPDASTTCLLIGGRGFVGSAIAAAADAAGWRVTTVGRDDYAGHTQEQFDVLINANGNAQRFKADREPLWDFERSVRPVYASLFECRFTHYVLISSVDVYNDASTPATTSENTPIDPATLPAYGFHKRLAELCVERQARSWQIFRLAQMLGVNLTKGPVFDLLGGRPLWIHPASQMPYMNTRSVGGAVIGLIERAPRNTVYNVCGRGSVEFAKILGLCGMTEQEVHFAAHARQTYRINTEKTERLCLLPDSWNEVRTFIEAAKPAHGA